tara:strand:+ start:395 stop:526 length:132 start_codon:yes stop_codon:yes gene_type:complete
MVKRQRKLLGIVNLGNPKKLFANVKVPTRFGYQKMQVPLRFKK